MDMSIMRSAISKYVPNEAARLNALNVLEKVYHPLQEATQRREARQDWIEQIKRYSQAGKVALIKWERDCDCVEAVSRVLVDATPAAVDEEMEHDFEVAEGPVTHWLASPDAPFDGGIRDRVLEAFENGECYSV